MNITKKWLHGFNIDDRGFILDLLSKFQIVPLSTMVDDLLNEAKYQILNREIVDQIVMIESIISTEDVRAFFRNHKKGTSSEGRKPSVEIKEEHWLQVKDFFGDNKNSRMLYISYDEYFPSSARTVDSGSEHFTDLIKRQLRAELDVWSTAKSARVKISEASQTNFDEVKQVSLFLMVDNIGSGKQSASFLLSTIYGLERKLTVNSMVNITIISWCASNLGIRRMNRLISTINKERSNFISFKIKLVFLNYTKTLDDAYLPEMRNEVKSKLVVLSSGVSEKWILGFEQAASLTIFEGMSCPNTTPGIFYITNSNAGPLFVSKYVPRSFNEEMNEILRSGSFSSQMDPINKFQGVARSKNILLGLRASYGLADVRFQLLSHLALEDDRMVAFAHCPGLRSEQLAAERDLQGARLIDVDSRVLESGTAALKNYGRMNRYKVDGRLRMYSDKRMKIDSPRSAYYPKSIDGVT